MTCTVAPALTVMPLSTEQIDDPYRRGIIAVHDAEIAAELDWLRSMLGVENESVTE